MRGRKEADVRQLLLALLGRSGDGPTFGALALEWLAEVERVCVDNEARHVLHLLPLHRRRDGELTAGHVERAMAASGLGPSTQNMLRSTGKLIIAWAQANGRWVSPNPFALVRRRRQPRRVYQTLTLCEVTRLLSVATGHWLHRIAVGVLLGLRPGELAALRPSDVDLVRGSVWIHRSHERAQTKTGRERLVAIPRCARGFIETAIKEGGERLFPSRLGGQMGRNAKLSKTFRALLRAADIGREVRFYDLRHTSATLHREAGCDPLVIRLTLGHAARNLTDDLYTHISLESQARELSRLCICLRCANIVL